MRIDGKNEAELEQLERYPTIESTVTHRRRLLGLAIPPTVVSRPASVNAKADYLLPVNSVAFSVSTG